MQILKKTLNGWEGVYHLNRLFQIPLIQYAIWLLHRIIMKAWTEIEKIEHTMPMIVCVWIRKKCKTGKKNEPNRIKKKTDTNARFLCSRRKAYLFPLNQLIALLTTEWTWNCEQLKTVLNQHDKNKYYCIEITIFFS